MSAQPPLFEKKPNCNKCTAAFGLFIRQHHCRNCGKSFCDKCSDKSAPLLQFGFTEPVRVCDVCHHQINIQPKKPASKQSESGRSSSITASSSSSAGATSPSSSSSSSDPLSVSSSLSSSSSSAPAAAAKKKVTTCKCNMPLCICPPDATPVDTADTTPAIDASKSTVAKKPLASAPTSSNTIQSTSTFQGFSFAKPSSVVTYDMSGDLNEQCREAIKTGDNPGVKKLLAGGADAKYVDRTGNTLLHLAAMFNRLEVVELLIDRGADPLTKNPAGETPIDLAPPALQFKIKELKAKRTHT